MKINKGNIKNLIFLTNESRSRQLEISLSKIFSSVTRVEYDPIPPFYKWLAILTTIDRSKRSWWLKMQFSNITQRGRIKNLEKALSKCGDKNFKILMWGSWFNPKKSAYNNSDFYCYIDQSCNKQIDKNDILEVGIEKAMLRFNKIQYETYSDSKAIFCMSQWCKYQTLECHKINEGKISVVGWGPIGVNLINEAITWDEENPYVLFVGHDYYRKGVDYLRAAIPLVVAKMPNIRFIVVGKNTQKLIVENHKNMEIVGEVRDNKYLIELYRKAICFVLPHRFDRSPHVIAEAMSAGKAIVTSNQGGPKEAVESGKNGFIIEIGDVKKMAEHLIAIAKSKELRQKFGDESKRRAREYYNWDSIANKISGIMLQ
jgi:glycosyltransferase involved in cell wall biosynthesis